jgi:hypothetical protein
MHYLTAKVILHVVNLKSAKEEGLDTFGGQSPNSVGIKSKSSRATLFRSSFKKSRFAPAPG